MELVKEKSAFLVDFEKQPVSPQPAWLQDLRREAFEVFSNTGFPTQKDEAFRFTDLRPVSGRDWAVSTSPVDIPASALKRRAFANLGCPRITFLNGFYCAELSDLSDLPEGVRVMTLSQAVETGEDSVSEHLSKLASPEASPIAALNTAFFQDGAFVEVASGVRADTPVQVLFLTTDGMQGCRTHPRNLFVVGESAEFQIVESYLSLTDEVYFQNPLTEVMVGPNANVEHCRVQDDASGSYHVGVNDVRLERDSYYFTQAVDLGALLTRNDLRCVLEGEGGLAGINGLYLLSKKQHVDNYTTLEHATPNCDSRELFKGILDHHARGIFRGRIIVHKDAQSTDSKQTNNNLILSDDALVNTKPQLEIYADDVKCTHGATIGQLDATSLFYLRSRGISELGARSLLIYAFAAEVIEKIRTERLREELIEYLVNWLPKGDLVKEVYDR